MSFHDIHKLNLTRASGNPYLLNDLAYLKDGTFLPINKQKSIGGCTRRIATNERLTPAEGSGIGWISSDVTTMDPQRSTRMCLDSAPMTSQVTDYWAIYDKNSENQRYKSIYYDWTDLPGQIQYYVDPEMTNPFFSPLFDKNVKAFGAVYIDPTNNVHYDFRRAAFNQSLKCDDCDIPEFRDLNEHRQDLVSNIMRSRNKNEYEPIYFNFTTRYTKLIE